MNRAPKSTEAFDELIAALQEIRDGYVLNEDRFTEDIDVVEGFRYVTEVLSGASSSSWRPIPTIRGWRRS